MTNFLVRPIHRFRSIPRLTRLNLVNAVRGIVRLPGYLKSSVVWLVAFPTILHRSAKARRKAIALVLTLSLVISLIRVLIPPKEASAAWYDEAWAYRTKITFGNTGAADSNKKVKFDIDTATQITAGKMQSDCGDSRFTDINGVLYQYYIDTVGGACNTSSTDYYVLIPSIITGTNTLFHYFGNPTVANGTQASQFSQATFTPTSGPTIGSEEQAPTPVAYWNFDEGYNTIAHDHTTFGNNATIDAGSVFPSVEKQINIIDQEYTTTGSAQPTDNSLGEIYWDADAYSGETVYFEAVIKCSVSCSGGNAQTKAELYTSGGSTVTGASVIDGTTTYTRVRSSDITANLTDNTTYTVRLTRDATSGTAAIQAARLIIVQSGSSLTATETQIETGSNTTTTSGTSVSMTDTKIIQYDHDAYNSGSINSYFEATIKGTTGTSPKGPNGPSVSGDCVQVANADAFATVSWGTPGNAFSNNTTYTTASVDGSATEWLQCTNFGFAIPSSATIDGIVVEAETFSSSTNNGGSSDYQARIVKGGAIGATDRAAVGAYGTSPDVYISHGGSTDKWGETWAASNINASNFGFALSSQKALATGPAHTVSVDFIRITVYFTYTSTTTAELYNLTDGATVSNSTVTIASSSWTSVRGASALSGANWDTTNDDIYEVRIKTSDTSGDGGPYTAYISNAKIVVQQTGSPLTKTESYLQLNNRVMTQATSTYTSKEFMNQFNDDNFTSGTFTGYFESTLKTSSGVDAYFARLDTPIGEVTASDTSYTRKRSLNIWSSLPTTATNLDVQLKNASTSTTSSATSWLIVQASSLTETPSPDTNQMWKPQELCVVGGCLFFDGSNDVVTAANASPIDLDDYLAGQMTFQAWIRVNSDGEGTGGEIFHKGTNNYMRVTNEGADGLVDLEVKLDLTTTAATASVTNGITLNKWHHVAFGYTDDGDDEISVYIDGNLAATSSNGDGSPANDTNNLLIGGSTSNNFHGFIDEFKVYHSQRTIDQIKTDFIKTSSLHGAQAGFGAPNTSVLSDGLVGYWKMDETAADTCGASNDSCDSSGNNQDGAWTGGATTAAAKFGEGVTLSATGDYVNIGDSAYLSPTSQVTISAWVNPSTSIATKAIVVKDTAYRLVTDGSGNPQCQVYDGSTWQTAATSSTTLSLSSWQHVACSYDSGTARVFVNGAETGTSAYSVSINDSTSALRLGSDSSGAYGNYLGLMDEARVYKIGFTPDRMNLLYEYSISPFLYYKLDENSGTTSVNDSSSRNKTGTIGGSMTGKEWVPGKYGSALNFDGVNDNISRTDDDELDFTTTDSFTLESWIKHTTQASGQDIILAKYETTGGDGGYKLLMEADGDITCGVDNDNSTFPLDFFTSTAATYDDDTWHHVACVKNGSTSLDLYIDGALIGQDTSLTTSGTYANNDTYYAGIDGDGTSNAWLGQLDEIKIYRYARSQSQVVEDMNAGHPLGGSPVGSPKIFWKFDEMTGSTSNNSGSDGALDGTNTTTAWLSEGSCKIGACLNLDAQADLVSAGDPTFTDNIQNLTVSLWLNPQTLSVDDTIVSKSNLSSTNSFLIRTDSTNSDEIRVYIANTASDSSNYATTTDFNLATGGWTHLAVVYDGTQTPANRLKIYKNGLQVSSTITGTISNRLTNSNTSNLKVGDSDITGSEGLIAYYDQVKVYDSSLTAAYVKVDATAGSASAFGGVLGTHDNEGFGGAWPVGYWPLDENTGITTTYDKSGNNLDGTLTNIEASDWVAGKYGSALNLDGSNEYIDRGTGPSSVRSISFWVYPNTTTEYFVNLTSTTVYIWLNAGTLTATGFTGTPTYYVNGQKTQTMTAGSWQHAVVTTTSAENASNLDIGRTADANYLEGKIDDVKLFDYALSQAQVAYAFNRGGPVGYWKFDECSGETAYDSSGKGNNGTLTPGSAAGGNNDTAGTCNSGATNPTNEMWNAGGTGKRNYSLDFDGGNDFVTITDNDALDITGDFTISAWAQRDAGAGAYVISKLNSATSGGYAMVIGGSGDVYCRTNDGVASTDSKTITGLMNVGGGWHHLAITRTGTSCRVYFDGIDRTSTAATHTTLTANALPLHIGDTNAGVEFWNGEIDDVGLFNYGMTAAQIKRLYNGGAQFFGPATGAP